MIRCGECGFAVTAEERTNRYGYHYTYYHCSKHRLDYRCRQRYVSLRVLEEQIMDFIGEVTLPDGVHRWAIARLERLEEQKAETWETERHSLEQASEAAARQLENLTKLRLRDLLTDEEYVKERQRLERERLGLTQRLASLGSRGSWFEPAQLLISLSKSLPELLSTADTRTRRLILEIVDSNLVLKDKKLSIDARKPFRRWSGTVSRSDMCSFVEDIRTFSAEPEWPKLVAALRKLEPLSSLKSSMMTRYEKGSDLAA